MHPSTHSEVSIRVRPPLQEAAKPRRATLPDSLLHPRSVAPVQNDLLAALPAEELQFLLPHLEYVHLSFDKQLFEYDNKLSYVYFPTTAIVALIYVLADGGVTEIGVVGHEGMVGISALMGGCALGTAIVQCTGHAFRLEASILKDACSQGGHLQQLLMNYAQDLFAQMAQNAVSSKHYAIDQQLSRWLLNRLDRLPSTEVKATQEMIANMLGVRRESITEAAGKLQQDGLILCRRGNITVLDRKGLELHAGECYKASKHRM